MKQIAMAVSVLTLLSACAVTAEQGVMEAQTRKGGVFGMSTNEQVVVDTDAAFKGVQKVIIGGFKVGFNDSK